MRIKEFEALPAGVYTVKMSNDEPEVALLTRNQVLVLSDGTTLDPVFGPASLALIEWMRPLERQGGLSGAMYWGDPV